MKELDKVYGNGTVALSDVNMTINEGEFICFLGPSGCGKSTIFKLIAGLEERTRGDIEILGMSPKEARKQSDIAFVFQDHTLLPWCSVIDNVMLPLKLRGVPKQERLQEAERVLALVGLSDHRKSLPRHLSGGMKMRVSIARALASRPKLLLMDEPFGALDEITRQSLQDELLKIWQQDPSMTVLFVTHNTFEAVYLSTQIVAMTARPGRVSAVLNVDEPFPRDDSFRTSAAFSQWVRTVSEHMQH
ncbi:ABC transporter ATP-binding protein [Paenibacillus phyllosphaerae]